MGPSLEVALGSGGQESGARSWSESPPVWLRDVGLVPAQRGQPGSRTKGSRPISEPRGEL